MSSSIQSKLSDRWQALSFLVFLWLPLAATFMNFDPHIPLNENRELATYPTLNDTPITRFPNQLEEYFNDHFGLRNLLISAHGRLSVNVFQTGSHNGVLVGKEGCLYLNDDERLIGLWTRSAPYTFEELEEYRRVLEERRDWLAQQDIEYLFAMIPEKQSVYPEYLPDWVEPLSPMSRMEQLSAHLAEHSDINFVDLKPLLIEARKDGDTYWVTDTHWNNRGAYLGYRAIADKLAEILDGFEPLNRTEVKDIPRGRIQGDLAQMLTAGSAFTEEMVKLSPTRLPPAEQTTEGLHGSLQSDTNFIRFRPGSDLPKAVILQDSFGNAISELWDQHFSRVAYYQYNPLVPAMVQNDKPDVVIQSLVERYLFLDPPMNGPRIKAVE